MRAFLRAHNINLNIFFDDAEEAREFAKDKVCTSYYFMAAYPIWCSRNESFRSIW